MSVRKINGKEQFDSVCNEAARSSKFLVADFSAAWCGPCQMMAPILEEFAKRYEAKAIVAYIDVDENEDLVQEMGIEALPTFHKYKGTQKVEESVGASREKLEALFTAD